MKQFCWFLCTCKQQHMDLMQKKWCNRFHLSPYSFVFFSFSFLLDRSSDMSATARDSQAKANLLSPSFRVLL